MSRAVVLHSRSRPRAPWAPVRTIAGAVFLVIAVTGAPVALLVTFAALSNFYWTLFRDLGFNPNDSGHIIFAALNTALLVGALALAFEWGRREMASSTEHYTRWLADEVTHLRQLERIYVEAMAGKEKREEQ